MQNNNNNVNNTNPPGINPSILEALIDQETTISAAEYVATQTRLEQEAAQVLPYSFDTCTYKEGHVTQPVYSCETCATENGGDPLGVCYSCFISCHSDHKVHELFAKRSFRCDCPTPKCPINCTLNKHLNDPSDRPENNSKNTYDHNFAGRFCWCNKLYDVETEDSTMYQCIGCEDWYHELCLEENGGFVKDREFEVLFCRNCVGKHSFLNAYVDVLKDPCFMVSAPTSNDAKAEEEEVVEKEEGQDLSVGSSSKRKASEEPESIDATTIKEEEEVTNKKPKLEEAKEEAPKTTAPTTTTCLINSITSSTPTTTDTTSTPPTRNIFLQEAWKTHLCHCPTCTTYYESTNLQFLVHEEQEYEFELDTDVLDTNNLSLLDRGLEELNRIDRVAAINGILAYNSFKEELFTFLRDFAEEGKVVNEVDVRRFFEEKMEERRRERLD